MADDFNPFESPAEIQENTGRLAAEPSVVLPYASGHTRGVVAVILLGLTILVSAITIVADLSQIELLDRMQNGGENAWTETEATENDQRQGILAVMASVLYLATALPFCMWVHRAHRNLPALGGRSLQYSPDWAVGYYFVPILNLFRPYQVMREIWFASDPNGEPKIHCEKHQVYAPGIIKWWWALFLLMNMASNVAGSVMRAAQNAPPARIINALTEATFTSTIVTTISILAAIMAIIVIRNIDQRQTDRFERLRSPEQAPRSPGSI